MKNNNILFFITLILLSFTFTIKAFSAIDPFHPRKNHQTFSLRPHTRKITHLESVWLPIYFTKASLVASILQNKSLDLLSQHGHVQAISPLNEIWINDDKSHIKKLTTFIEHMDKPKVQFGIKAKIINIDREYRRDLGVIFHTTTNNKNTNYPGNNTSDVASNFALSIAKLSESELLNVQINALERSGHALLISAPSLIALDGQPAVIESGDEIPYEEETPNGGTTAQFKKAVLQLKVTPKRLQHNKILLKISVNQDKASALSVRGIPAIETQSLHTTVMLKNHQTVILGGIIRRNKTREQTGVALLNHIPLLGRLFRTNQTDHHDEELLIIISPTLLPDMTDPIKNTRRFLRTRSRARGE